MKMGLKIKFELKMENEMCLPYIRESSVKYEKLFQI